MSYARIGGGSDVYVIARGTGIECVGCLLHGEYQPEVFTDLAQVFQHLDEHEAKGEKVPDYTRPALYRDWSNGLFTGWDTTKVEAMLPYWGDHDAD